MLSKGLTSHRGWRGFCHASSCGKKRVFCKTNPTGPSMVVENRAKAPFDRTQTQLERLQLMRLGQPVLPNSKYNILWPDARQETGRQKTKGHRELRPAATPEFTSRCMESKLQTELG